MKKQQTETTGSLNTDDQTVSTGTNQMVAPTTSTTTPHSKLTKKILLPIAVGVAVLLLVLGGLWYRAERQAAAQRAAFLAQQQKLLDFWKAEGLSDEQVQTKMRENRTQQRPPDMNSPWFSLLRSFRHATGIGPGVGGRSAPLDGGRLGTAGGAPRPAGTEGGR